RFHFLYRAFSTYCPHHRSANGSDLASLIYS
ncbi:MAG: hypothetical protein ACI8U1_001828, partial [Rheinheimera aquimaris]